MTPLYLIKHANMKVDLLEEYMDWRLAKRGEVHIKGAGIGQG
jgi:hypothetical protein